MVDLIDAFSMRWSMPHTRLGNDEIARRGKELYAQSIRSIVEPNALGQFLALDVETGDYEVSQTAGAAIRKMKSRHPDPALYLIRVGRPAAYRLGGRFRIAHS